jgi:hypothetical protein
MPRRPAVAPGRLSLFLRRRFTAALFREFFSNRAFYHLRVENAALRLLEVEQGPSRLSLQENSH